MHHKSESLKRVQAGFTSGGVSSLRATHGAVEGSKGGRQYDMLLATLLTLPQEEFQAIAQSPSGGISSGTLDSADVRKSGGLTFMDMHNAQPEEDLGRAPGWQRQALPSVLGSPRGGVRGTGTSAPIREAKGLLGTLIRESAPSLLGGVNSGHHNKPTTSMAPPRALLASGNLASSGAYPLATPERVQAATLDRLERERLAAEKKRKADQLKARLEAKRQAKELAGVGSVKMKRGRSKRGGGYEDLGTAFYTTATDPDAWGPMSSLLRGPDGRVSFYKTARLVRLMNSSLPPPPKQKSKLALNSIKVTANKAALKKLWLGWPMVMAAFRAPKQPVGWPVAQAPPDKPLLSLLAPTPAGGGTEDGGDGDKQPRQHHEPPAAPPLPTGKDLERYKAAIEHRKAAREGDALTPQSSVGPGGDAEGALPPISSASPNANAGGGSGGGGGGSVGLSVSVAGGGLAHRAPQPAPIGLQHLPLRLVVPFNFQFGAKGTCGMRDLFGLLAIGLHLSETEQEFVVETMLGFKGAADIYAMEPPETRHHLKLGKKRMAKKRGGGAGGLSAASSSRMNSSRGSPRGASRGLGSSQLSSNNREGDEGGGGAGDRPTSKKGGARPPPVRPAPEGLAYEDAHPAAAAAAAEEESFTSSSSRPGSSSGSSSSSSTLASLRGGTSSASSSRPGSRPGTASSSVFDQDWNQDYDDDGQAISGPLTPDEELALKAEAAKELNIPTTVSYKEFFDALEPRGEALSNFEVEVKKELDFAAAKKKAEEDKQLGLLEAQAAKRAHLVAELSQKFAYPPTKELHASSNSWGPSVSVPPVHKFNTRTRQKQLMALMIDGGMVLDLLHGHGGGLGQLLQQKKGQAGALKQPLEGLVTHVPLAAGRPYGGVKEVVLAAATYGAGLQGLSPTEAVEALWIYCAERIQSKFRGAKNHKAQGGALRMWRKRDLEWKRQVFRAWANANINLMALKYCCNKPFKMWAQYATLMKKTHHLFAKCFWPLYVWRKTTREAILERQKAEFLRKAYLTYFQLHVFRAWKGWAQKKTAVNRLCDGHRDKTLAKKQKRSFHFWRRHITREKGVERAWLRVGMRKHDDKELEVLWRCVTVWRYWRTLSQVVYARANQYWRTVSADRERIAGIRKAEARARRRARRRGKKTAKEVAAQKEQEAKDHADAFKDFPKMPKLRQLAWGKGLPAHLHDLCGKMVSYMDKELLRECGQRHLSFWREGPRFFRTMRERVSSRKKKAGALRFAARNYLHTYCEAWRVAARVKRQAREARRRERATEKRVRAQRETALEWAREQSNTELVYRLEKEEADANKLTHARQMAKQERLENASDASVSSEDEDRDGADDVAAVTGNARTMFAVPLAKDRAKLWLAKAKKNAEKNKPNLLESDREARREQNRRVRVMLDEAKRKEARIKRERAGFEDEQKDWERDMEADKVNLGTFFTDEEGKMARACGREIKYMSEFKMHMARKIYNLLTSVRAASEETLNYVLSWHYFRRLRLPYFERKSLHMRNRAILKNRLRLCKRLQHMLKGAPALRRLRVKWRVFNAWLGLVDNRYACRTPGLKQHVLALSKRAKRFHDLLAARGCGASRHKKRAAQGKSSAKSSKSRGSLGGGPGGGPLAIGRGGLGSGPASAGDSGSCLAFEFKVLHPKASDLKGCLLRWALYCCDSMQGRATSRLLAWRRRFTVLRSTFRALASVTLGLGMFQATVKAARVAEREAGRKKLADGKAKIFGDLDDGESWRDADPLDPDGNYVVKQQLRNLASGTNPTAAAAAAARGGGLQKQDNNFGGSSQHSPTVLFNTNQNQNQTKIIPDPFGSPSEIAGSIRSSSNHVDDDDDGDDDGGHSLGGSSMSSEAVSLRAHQKRAGAVANDLEAIMNEEEEGGGGGGGGGEEQQVKNLGDLLKRVQEKGSNNDDFGQDFGDSIKGNPWGNKGGDGEDDGSAVMELGIDPSGSVASMQAAKRGTRQGRLKVRRVRQAREKEAQWSWSPAEADANGGVFLGCPKQPVTYVEKRVLADLHAWRNGYAAKRSRWLSSLILKANKQREVQCITKAIHGPSFRKFLTVMKISAAKRLKVERTLLLEAFVSRGKLGVRNYTVPPEPQPVRSAHAAAEERQALAKQQSKAEGLESKDGGLASPSAVSSSSSSSSSVPPGIGSGGGGKEAAVDNRVREDPGAALAAVEVEGEVTFKDRSVWSAYMLDEVNVFWEAGRGVMGVCCSVCGDGRGQTELLPRGGVKQPHGCNKGRTFTFKLRTPYEHCCAVTLVMGTASIEVLQLHCHAPDGEFMRDSPLLGVPFSPDAKRVRLGFDPLSSRADGNGSSGLKATDMLVGFCGRHKGNQDNPRLTALGLLMREVTSNRTVLSCSWTPKDVKGTVHPALSKLAAVRATTKEAQWYMLQEAIAGGGGKARKKNKGGAGGGLGANALGSSSSDVGVGFVASTSPTSLLRSSLSRKNGGGGGGGAVNGAGAAAQVSTLRRKPSKTLSRASSSSSSASAEAAAKRQSASQGRGSAFNLEEGQEGSGKETEDEDGGDTGNGDGGGDDDDDDDGGGGAKKKRVAGGVCEERRLAVEEGLKAERDVMEGNWDSFCPLGIRSADEETVQVAEFTALLRMRSADVGSACDRASALARRMWLGDVCRDIGDDGLDDDSSVGGQSSVAMARQVQSAGGGGGGGGGVLGDHSNPPSLQQSNKRASLAQSRPQPPSTQQPQPQPQQAGSFAALRKLSVISGLCKWYFAAVSFSLSPEAPCDPFIPDRLEARGEKFLAAASSLSQKAARIRRHALGEDAKPRKWATDGMRTPEDRRLESEFKKQFQAWLKESDGIKATANRYEEEGRGFLARAAPLRPRLPSTLASHLYYKTRLDLARTQRKMENEFGRDFFTETLNKVKGQHGQAALLSDEKVRRLKGAIETEPLPGTGPPGV